MNQLIWNFENVARFNNLSKFGENRFSGGAPMHMVVK